MVKLDNTVEALDSMNVYVNDLTVRNISSKNIDFVIQIHTIDGLAYGLVDNDGNVTISNV